MTIERRRRLTRDSRAPSSHARFPESSSHSRFLESPSTVQYRRVLYSTVQYCTVLYGTVQYCTVLYSTILNSTVQSCTILYSTVQYCTVLYSTRPLKPLKSSPRGQNLPGDTYSPFGPPKATFSPVWPPGFPFLDKCFLDFAILGPLKAKFDQLDR